MTSIGKEEEAVNAYLKRPVREERGRKKKKKGGGGGGEGGRGHSHK